MRGLMMDYPLTLRSFVDRAERLFPSKEIVTRTRSGRTAYTYAAFAARVRRLAGALLAMGVGKGDRVATFAWNDSRHLELYFAVPLLGAVLHTVNVRLSRDQLVHVIRHAGDRVLFVDAGLVSDIAALSGHIPSVERFVVMGDPGEVRGGPLSPVDAYESLLEGASEVEAFPAVDERDAAAMCYTSGTTGDPKGVVYSHRALFLHSMAEAIADAFAISERDVVMPVVPMFHVNGWGLPYTSTMVGAKQVLVGPRPQARDLAALIESERVTVAAGVPTVWIGLYRLLQEERFDLRSLRTIIVGGAAVPRGVLENFERTLGVRITHAWGMTETTPLGTVSLLKGHLEAAPEDARFGYRAKQGLPVPGVELKAVDGRGQEIPWDGTTMGEFLVRGPWVASGYHGDSAPDPAFTPDGWFRTGDVGTIDPEGYMEIADRTKDLIKSGGEWISSVALESALMAHPDVEEAAVIAIPHPTWQERPLACVVRRAGGAAAHKGDLLALLEDRFPKFWLPDDFVFVDEIPKTSVGKFDKKALRERFSRVGSDRGGP